MLAIIIALESEISNVEQIKKESELIISNDIKFYLNLDKSIVFGFCGVGKVNAASCVSNLLKTFSNINRIVNIGMAGCSDPKLKLGSIIMVDDYYYLDVDATIFGYKYGQVPRELEKFSSFKNDQMIIEALLTKNNFSLHSANIGTSDSFIDKNNIAKFPKSIIDNISLFDMESTAIAQVCSKNNKNFSSIKIVSDNIFLNTKDSTEFNSSLMNYSKLIENIIFVITTNKDLF